MVAIPREVLLPTVLGKMGLQASATYPALEGANKHILS